MLRHKQLAKIWLSRGHFPQRQSGIARNTGFAFCRRDLLAIADGIAAGRHPLPRIFNSLPLVVALHSSGGIREASVEGLFSSEGPMTGWIHFLLQSASTVSLYIVRPRRAQREALSAFDGLPGVGPDSADCLQNGAPKIGNAIRGADHV
jgi:hypothetical protein